MSQCDCCKHRRGEKFIEEHGWWTFCSAFPKVIPREIWLNYVDHTRPYPGDGGVRFEPRIPSDIKDQAKIFRPKDEDRDSGWDIAKFKALEDAAIQAEEQREQEKAERQRLQREFVNHPALQYNPALLARYQHQAGFWSTDDASHVTLHEAGHEALVESIYSINALTTWGRVFPHLFDREHARRIHDEKWAKLALETDIELSTSLAQLIQEEVGRHAFQSLTEFVAEVYAGLTIGRTYSSEVIKQYRGVAGPDV